MAANDGILYKGQRMVIPKSCQKDLLERLHSNHQGIEATLRRGRDSIYWPGMTNDIKQMIESCQVFERKAITTERDATKSRPSLEAMGKGWDRLVHVCQCHLVDYYSDFFEFTKLVDQRAETTIQACKFISAEFQAFANNWEFKHSMSSPYHSQSNGKAESAVKIVKNFLKKSDDPLRAVLEWRNTPTSQINCSPVQRLMQRRTRASVPQAEQLMKPVVLTARKILRRKVKKQKMPQQYYDRNARDLSPLRRGTPVFVQSLKKYDASKWAQGMVADQCSNRSYIVEIEGRLLRRNRRYLRIDHTIRHNPSTSTEQEDHRDGTHSRDTHVIPTDENTDSRELESCERPAFISTLRPEPVPTSPVKTNSLVKTRSGRRFR